MAAIAKVPNERHFPWKLKTWPEIKPQNTVILPGVDVTGDLAAINRGEGEELQDTDDGDRRVKVNGRTYVQHPWGTLYPESGPGTVPMDADAYGALVERLMQSSEPEHSFRSRLRGGGCPYAKIDEALDVFAEIKARLP